MGQISSAWQKERYQIPLFGIDTAGKTTLLYWLVSGGEIIQTIPTIGFNVETVPHQNAEFIIWDVGGGCKIPPLWCHYVAKDCKGVIFVVNSSDRERISELRQPLQLLLQREEFRHLRVLVFGNMQDLENPMNATEIAEALDMHSIPQRHWHIQLGSVKKGEGIRIGLTWLLNAIRSIDTDTSKEAESEKASAVYAQALEKAKAGE